ncbi:hypothetical protein GE09DRAFT_1056873 [Coniochaeta sp. 2T2.1]|nr:hypothetical protein GE09DRAFT_1056873 [Coniochaeta sp. 2T2.1]
MLLRDLLLLSLGICGAYAQILKRQGAGNLTVAFLPTSEEATCEQNNIANAVSLTTDTVPTHYVCFNLTEFFSQANDTGTRNGSKWSSTEVYQGVEYTLGNRRSYDPDANYTNVWYQQVKLGGSDVKPGAEGHWVFYMYAFEDCIQNGGDEYEIEEWPWFETSCQTNDVGECRQVPKPIRSFAIGPGDDYNAIHGRCEVWARLGEGASMWNRQTAALLVVAAAMATLLVL